MVDPVWPKIMLSVVLVLIPLFVGAGFFMRTQVHACKGDWTDWDAMWWAFATITTIGYGDLSMTCQRDKTQLFLTVYIFISVVVVAAGLSNLSTVYDVYCRQTKERRLLNEFDIDRIMAMDLDGDGVQKAEFLIGMLVAMEAVDPLKLELYSSKFDELDADGSGVLDHEDLVVFCDQIERKKRASEGPRGSSLGKSLAPAVKVADCAANRDREDGSEDSFSSRGDIDGGTYGGPRSDGAIEPIIEPEVIPSSWMGCIQPCITAGHAHDSV